MKKCSLQRRHIFHKGIIRVIEYIFKNISMSYFKNISVTYFNEIHGGKGIKLSKETQISRLLIN